MIYYIHCNRGGHGYGDACGFDIYNGGCLYCGYGDDRGNGIGCGYWYGRGHGYAYDNGNGNGHGYGHGEGHRYLR